MGIIEVDLLEPIELDVLKDEILHEIAVEGGYIMGSAEGLSANTPLDSFKTLYSLRSP